MQRPSLGEAAKRAVQRFRSVEPNGLQCDAMTEVRGAFIHLATTLERLLQDGRMKSLCLTNLEEAAMWATKSIAHESKGFYPDGGPIDFEPLHKKPTGYKRGPHAPSSVETGVTEIIQDALRPQLAEDQHFQAAREETNERHSGALKRLSLYDRLMDNVGNEVYGPAVPVSVDNYLDKVSDVAFKKSVEEFKQSADEYAMQMVRDIFGPVSTESPASLSDAQDYEQQLQALDYPA